MFLYAKNNSVVNKKKKKKDKSSLESKKKSDEEKRKRKIRIIKETLELGTQNEILMAMQYIVKLKIKKNYKTFIKDLIKLLNDESDISVIRKSISILTQWKIKSASKEVIKLLQHENREVKISAISFISALEIKEAQKSIIEIFKKQKYDERDMFTIQIINTLSEFKSLEFAQLAHLILEKYFSELSQSDYYKKNKPKNKKIEKYSEWLADHSETPEIEIVKDLILSIGKINYQYSRYLFKSLLLSSFANEDQEIKIPEKMPKIKIKISTQGYLIHSLGKLKLNDFKKIAIHKLKLIEKYGKDKKRRFYSLYIRSLAALARSGDEHGIKILIKAIKDNAPGVRMTAIRLVTELKIEKAIKYLTFRAIRDSHKQTGFAAFRSLMEYVELGCTKNGKKIGTKASSSAQKKALQGIFRYMNPKRNNYIRYSTLRFLVTNLYKNEIESEVTKYLQTKIKKSLGKIEQRLIVVVLQSLIVKKFKVKQTYTGNSYNMIKKLAKSKRLKYARISASKSLRFLKKLK